MTVKDAYLKKIEARLLALDAEITSMKAKAKAVDAEAQIEYTQALSDLRELRKNSARKFDALRDAGEMALDDVIAGMENAWKELNVAMDQAKSRFE